MDPLHPRKVLQILDSLLYGNSSQVMRNPLQPLDALLQSKRHMCKWLGRSLAGGAHRGQELVFEGNHLRCKENSFLERKEETSSERDRR